VQYPLVEFFVALLFSYSFFVVYCQTISWGAVSYDSLILLLEPKFFFTVIRDFIIIFTMVAIFVYDLRWYLIPDRLIIPASVIILLGNIFLGFNFVNLLILAGVGGGFFLIQFLLTRGKGIGGGDIRLGIFMGVALGRFDLLVLAMLISYTLGSVVGICLIIKGKKGLKSEMPLGVFLAIGTIVTLFFGENILKWYFSAF